MALPRPHWRKMTWVVVIWNVLMLIWLITGIASGSHATNCNGLSTSSCQAAADVGTTIGAGLLVALWVIGDVILGILWLVTRGRSCPTCGRSVRRGLVQCRRCGYDFRFAAPAPH